MWVTPSKPRNKTKDIMKHINIAEILENTSESMKKRINFVTKIIETNSETMESTLNDIINYIREKGESNDCICYIYNLIKLCFIIRPKETLTFLTILSSLVQIYHHIYIFNNDPSYLKAVLAEAGIINGKPLQAKSKTLFYQVFNQSSETNDPKPLCRIILEDDVNEFISMIATNEKIMNENYQIVLPNICSNSNFSKPIQGDYLRLIDACSLFGSVKCFKYLISNNFKKISPRCAIYGGNFEIIHIIENEGFSYNNLISEAIQFHHNEITEWLSLHYQSDCPTLSYCVKCYNDICFQFVNTQNDKENMLESFCMAAQLGFVDFFKENNSIQLIEKVFHFALLYNNLEIVKLLFEKMDKNRYSLLTNNLNNAAKDGFYDLVQFIFSKSYEPITDLSPLFYAIINNHIDIANFLVEKGFPIDSIYNTNIFHVLCMKGRFNGVKYLIENGYDLTKDYQSDVISKETQYKFKSLSDSDVITNIREKNTPLVPPLFLACTNMHFDIAKYLVENGADPNSGFMVLCKTCQDLDFIKYFVEKGANVNLLFKPSWLDNLSNSYSFRGTKYYSPITNACFNSNIEVIKYLIDSGADIRSQHLIEIAVGNQDIALLKYLVSKGADVNEGIPLLYAVSSGNFEMIKYLIENGCNLKSPKYTNIITDVITNCKSPLKIIEYLIEKGADTYISDPLFKAISMRQTEVIDLLLTKSPRLNLNSSIIQAIKANLPSIIPKLIEHGADVNNGVPLLKAFRNQYLEASKVLIQNGAFCQGFIRYALSKRFYPIIPFLLDYDKKLQDPTLLQDIIFELTNEDIKKAVEKGIIIGDKVLENAIQEHKFDVIPYLVEHGANPDEKDALTAAIESKHFPTVKYLVEKGADIDSHNGLYEACLRKNIQLINYFLDCGASIYSIEKSPLEIVLKYDILEALMAFENHGFDSLSFKPSLITIAFKEESPKISKYLISKQCELKSALVSNDSDTFNKILHSISMKDPECIEALLKSTNFQFTEDQLSLCFVNSMKKNSVGLVKIFHERGASLLKAYSFGNNKFTPLAFAFTLSDNSELLSYILPHHPPFIVEDDSAQPFVEFVNNTKNTSVLPLIYPYIPNVDAHFQALNNDFTFLTYAGLKGNFETMKYLILHGANINEKVTFNSRQCNLLYIVILKIQQFDYDDISFLISHGADYNSYSIPAMSYKLTIDNQRIIDIFLEHGIVFRKCIESNQQDNESNQQDNENNQKDNENNQKDNESNQKDNENKLNDNKNMKEVNKKDKKILPFPQTTETMESTNNNYLLHLAIREKNYTMLKKLLQQGADPNYYYYNDEHLRTSILFTAIERNKFDAVKILIQYKADPNFICPDAYMTNPEACIKTESVNIIEFLLDNGLDPNTKFIKYRNYSSLIFYAVHLRNIDLIEKLIDNGAQLNTVCDLTFTTPLAVALERNFEDIGLLLLKRGANYKEPQKIKYDKILPITYAFENGLYKIGKYLMDMGSPIDDRAACSILAFALKGNDMNLAKKLISENHCFDLFDSLYIACENNNFDLLKLLVEHGINVNKGKITTPLNAAIKAENITMVKYLLEHGANPNSHFQQFPPLFLAKQIQNNEMEQLLLKYGATENNNNKEVSSFPWASHSKKGTPSCNAWNSNKQLITKQSNGSQNSNAWNIRK